MPHGADNPVPDCNVLPVHEIMVLRKSIGMCWEVVACALSVNLSRNIISIDQAAHLVKVFSLARTFGRLCLTFPQA